jgi:hypothetical protein
MLQSAAITSTQTTYAFENHARFAAQASKESGAVGRSNTSVSSEGSSTPLVSRLTPQEEQLVEQLRQTDRLVRAHEQAHLSVGADLVRGGPTFSYQTGPDNQRYAVGGEVSIDTSPARTPQETIPKAQHIRATALAPADPSPQDHSVAAQAGRMESEARIELAVQQRDAATGADQGSARFYQGVAQSESAKGRLGLRLDRFA